MSYRAYMNNLAISDQHKNDSWSNIRNELKILFHLRYPRNKLGIDKKTRKTRVVSPFSPVRCFSTSRQKNQDQA